MSALSSYRHAVKDAVLSRRIGRVSRLAGLSAEVRGLHAGIGELCQISSPALATRSDGGLAHVLAEVVAVHESHAVVLPYGPIQGLATGCEVIALGNLSDIPVGPQLLGRVLDGFMNPLDSLPSPAARERRPVRAAAINPMQRPRITRVLETGIRCIDTLLTLGQGQRTGIFAGSGVGKSTLLGTIARHVKADVNVIALIGERGREVNEFIDKQLGAEGLKRSVVIVATSDQPALSRIRAAYAALTVAEYFRDQGKQVLLTLDSITRFAMARREVGLAAGEPPTARGYTPSVFTELPQLCERCGTSTSGGSITALMTVLVEGDDLNEPVSDHMRSILDGHIVLSRKLAHSGQYPAVDVLQSASRVMPDITGQCQQDLARETVKTLALLERNRQMVEMGAYEKGSNPELDQALACQPALQKWMRQSEGGAPALDALHSLQQLLKVRE